MVVLYTNNMTKESTTLGLPWQVGGFEGFHYLRILLLACFESRHQRPPFFLLFFRLIMKNQYIFSLNTQVSPHKKGLRNGPKALKPAPVIVRCK